MTKRKKRLATFVVCQVCSARFDGDICRDDLLEHLAEFHTWVFQPIVPAQNSN